MERLLRVNGQSNEGKRVEAGQANNVIDYLSSECINDGRDRDLAY